MRNLLSQAGRLRVAAAAVVIVTAAIATPTSADFDPDVTYAVDIDGTVSTETEGALGVYTGDADAAVIVTLSNSAVAQPLGSANVEVPSPLIVTAVDGAPYLGGSTVELRSVGLAAGASRTYTLTVQVDTCVTSPPVDFGIAAKVSSDYTGVDDFTLVEESSDTALELVGQCQLAFVGQPGSAVRTQTITSEGFEPTGAAITVEARDAGDTGRTEVTGDMVALEASRPGFDPAPGLGGTVSAATLDGLATFSPGPTLSISAYNYRLTAASTGLDSALSDKFIIVDGRAACPANATCSTETNVGGQDISASLSAGANNGNLLLSVDAGDIPDFECADYPHTDQLVSQFEFTGGSGRLATFTQVIPYGYQPVKDYQVCWAAPYPFETRKKTTAEIQGVKPGTTDPMWVGVLPDCAKKVGPPCVSIRKQDPHSRAITLSVLAPSDDPWRY